MLVTPPLRNSHSAPDSDRGSALVAVLVMIFVIALVGAVTAAVTVNTAGTTASVRGSLESQAAADAGLSGALARAQSTTADLCPASRTAPFTESTSAPRYTVHITDCGSTFVEFTSVGKDSSGAEFATTAKYAVTPPAAATPVGGADMVLFGDSTFTSNTAVYSPTGGMLDIVVPRGKIECQRPMPATFKIAGDFFANGGCVIDGDVTTGGALNINTNARIKGDATRAGAGETSIMGEVDGDITVPGVLKFNGSITYPGDVKSGGNIFLNSASVAGRVTLPSSAQLEKDWYIKIPSGTGSDARVFGGRAGGISWPATVTAPTAPTFDPWYDYKFKDADWPGFTKKVLTTATTGLWTCKSFNQNVSGLAPGWPALGTLTTPTIIDARACSELTSENGTNPNVTLNTDVVVLAKKFNLGGLQMNAPSGKTQKIWWINEDTTADSNPTCVSGAGISFRDTVMGSRLAAMIYTPCRIQVSGGGTWHGSYYAGSLQHGGELKFHGAPILLPGQSPTGGPGATPPAGGGASTATIGALISRSDGG